MTVRLFFAGIVALAFLGLVGRTVGEPGDKKDPFAEYLEKYGTPGPEHKLLEGLAGTWNAKAKFWMDPSKNPQTSEGTTVRKLVLGGRYLQESYEGKAFDKPFEGRGVL